MIVVRDAVLEDAERILEIYDYYVKNTAISFEYDTPSLAEFRGADEKDYAALSVSCYSERWPD